MTELVKDLRRRGVSLWVDDLDRAALLDGSLAKLMREHGVSGVTSNPAIFARSITGSSAYDGQLDELRFRGVGVDEARRALPAKTCSSPRQYGQGHQRRAFAGFM